MSENSVLSRQDRRALVRVAQKEEDILTRLEAASRDPFGRNRHLARGMDQELLLQETDPDEIENEVRINQHKERVFIQTDDVPEEVHTHGLHGECRCSDEQSCYMCCTQIDFEALPEIIRRIGVKEHERNGEFELHIPLQLAYDLDLLTPALRDYYLCSRDD